MKKSGKQREITESIRYIITGVTTTFISLTIYHSGLLLGADYKISNMAAIILGKIYGYFMNKLFVFRIHCPSGRKLMQEIVSYILARGFTGIIDFFGVILLVHFGVGSVISKYFMQVIVIVLNYVLGKLLVFKTQKNRRREAR